MKTTGRLKSINLDWKTHQPEITLQIVADPADVEKYSDKELSVEIKPYKKRRSLSANSYYWQLISKIAEANGESISYTHNLILGDYGQDEIVNGELIYVNVPDTPKGERMAQEASDYHLRPTTRFVEDRGEVRRQYVLLRGSHTYDTKEMSRLIDGAVQAAKDLGIETLTPDQLEEMFANEKHHAG